MDYKTLIDALTYHCSVCKRKDCAGHYWELERCKALPEAANAITELLARVEEAESRAEKAERERDAAIEDLQQMCVGGNTCAFCKHGRNCGKQGPGRKTVEPCWEWHGKKEEQAWSV